MEQSEMTGTAERAATPNRLLWLLIGGLLAGWFGYLAFFAPGMNPNLTEPGLGVTGASRAADFDWKLQDLEGNPASLADYRGKTIFLNLWATWCGPCVREMPSIEALASNEELRQKGVVVLAVATGGEDLEKVRRFVENSGYNRITFLSSEVAPPEVFLTQGIPATFLIGPDGQIAGAHVGSTEWNTPTVISFLEKLSEQGAIAVE